MTADWLGIMDQSLSDHSQQVMKLAWDESARLLHEYIGTEHILLGLASDSESWVAELLKSMGASLDRIRSEVEAIIGTGMPGGSPDELGLSQRATRVIEFAREEAKRLGSKLAGPEHLLLGICHEVNSTAAQVLCDLRVSPDSLQKIVWKRLNRGEEVVI